MINSRPILYVNDDINSLNTLTPAHFLSINHNLGVPVIQEEYYPKETSAIKLLETWRKGQGHLNKFWSIWSTEYLQEPRERNTTEMKPIKGEIKGHPKVGEVVLIKEEGLSCGKWKIGKVTKLIGSEVDGISRAVELATPSGRILRRPFQYIYPLECSNEYV